jgi:thiol:disulfide interchange protein DsbD
MGTALGFALTQTTEIALLVFSFLGLGMAFPYLLLTFCPFLLKFLPKPGPWMINFKRFLGVLLLATVLWLLWVLGTQLNWIKESSVVAPSNAQIAWQSYSPQLVNQLRKDNRIILIDFTAKWCLTCQVNERVALENPTVVTKLKELNVATVKADWTRYDASITQALAEYGKNSIPLYVLYSSNPKQEPVILPELITPKIILESLEQIKK